MREETKRSLEELLSKAEAGDDMNLKEAARVVRRDLLKGGVMQFHLQCCLLRIKSLFP